VPDAASDVTFSGQSAWLNPPSTTFTVTLGFSVATFWAAATIVSYSGLPAATPGTNTPMLIGAAETSGAASRNACSRHHDTQGSAFHSFLL